MGSRFKTLLNLEVIKSDSENNLIYIKRSIPGSKNSTIFLRKSTKTITRKTLMEKEVLLQKNQPTTAKASSKTSSQKGSQKEETKKLNEKKEVKKK